MSIIEVVGAVIVNEDNELFAAQRPEGKSLAGMWEFPGGKIEEGETPREALAREFKEELDCTIKVKEFITRTVYEYDFATIALSTYYSELEEGEIVLKEHQDAKWLGVSEISELEWAPADIPAINKIVKDLSELNEQ